MATVRKRGETWQVQVRRDGFPAVSKSFRSKVDAHAWAREVERSIDRNETSISDRSTRSLTVGDLLTRYERDISSKKRGAKFEKPRIAHFKTSYLGKIKVLELKSSDVARYRDQRLKTHSNETVRRELTILRHCLEIAKREWGISLLHNPVRQIALPKPSEARENRLNDGDYDRILASIDSMNVWYLRPIFIIAIETGMRRGEILSLTWDDIDLPRRTASLVLTKNGSSRKVPLSPIAILEISHLPQNDGYLFPITANALRLSWERLRARAGLKGLRFHDLRHEAISRFVEMGLSIAEVSLISGHRDYKTLSRYVNLRPSTIATKLALIFSTHKQ